MPMASPPFRRSITFLCMTTDFQLSLLSAPWKAGSFLFCKKCYDGCNLFALDSYYQGEEQKRKEWFCVEDAKIIALFWERNELAVKETDTAYGGKLYGLSNRILGNREDAEESVSDTYMETWKSIPPKQPT